MAVFNSSYKYDHICWYKFAIRLRKAFINDTWHAYDKFWPVSSDAEFTTKQVLQREIVEASIFLNQ